MGGPKCCVRLKFNDDLLLTKKMNVLVCETIYFNFFYIALFDLFLELRQVLMLLCWLVQGYKCFLRLKRNENPVNLFNIPKPSNRKIFLKRSMWWTMDGFRYMSAYHKNNSTSQFACHVKSFDCK